MPNPTTRNGFRKPDPGSDNNTWGSLLNSGVFDLEDDSLDGWVEVSTAGTTTLTTTQYVANQARMRVIHYSALTSGTVVIPSVEKWYLVWAENADVIISNGGSTATVPRGNVTIVITDGVDIILFDSRVSSGELNMSGHKIINVASPTSNFDASTKKYVDDTAFSSMAGTLPGQTGNAGNFLTTDGTDPAWASPYPSQTSNAGKILTTNGTTTSWLALGTVTDVLTGTTATPITGDALYDSAAPVALTDAATVAWDTNDGYNAYVILGGNRVIGQPTNLRSGVTYTIELVQDATGSRVPTWNAIWDFGAAGIPILQTTANKADKVIAQYNARTSKLDASFRKGA